MTEKLMRTTIHFEVLHEGPLPVHGQDLEFFAYETREGHMVGSFVDSSTMKSDGELTGPEMAKALRNAGSEASFFQLSDAGDPLDEDDEFIPRERADWLEQK